MFWSDAISRFALVEFKFVAIEDSRTLPPGRRTLILLSSQSLCSLDKVCLGVRVGVGEVPDVVPVGLTPRASGQIKSSIGLEEYV